MCNYDSRMFGTTDGKRKRMGSFWLLGLTPMRQPGDHQVTSLGDISKTSQTGNPWKPRGRWVSVLSTLQKKVATLNDPKTPKQPIYTKLRRSFYCACVCASKTLLRGVDWLLILVADHLFMSMSIPSSQLAKCLLYLYSNQTSA